MTLEKTTQNNLIEVFKRMGYQHLGSHIKLLGSSPKLDDNFKKQIERLNKDVLQGAELSKDEFQRLRNEYPKNHTDAFTKLRNGVRIVLDDNRNVSIKFLDRENFENNVYQITDELIIGGIKTNRLDLVILINGVPIANIEMKRAGEKNGVEKAIGQVNRYSDNGIYHQDLLSFIQFFGASDSVETRYFSVDPRTDRGASYGEFAFTWMDKNNKPVNKIEDFVAEFFQKEFLHRLLFHYMLIKPLPEEQILIMRPYQIHALHAIVSTLDKGLGFNTYISASTGSGKTLTSFKTAEVLASQGKKVIMLLDRNDLAEQTTKEFKQFDANGLIKDLVKGSSLNKSLRDEHDKFVITTIQSFTNWINKKKNNKAVERLANSKEVVILVDECHRSTSKEMFASIKRAFLDAEHGNILKCHLVGFTGTPLLEENSKTANQMTQVVFGEVSHIYTITEAVRDKSVLPFKRFTVNVQSGVDPKKISEYKKSTYFGNPLRIEANAAEIVEQFKNHTLQIDKVKTPSTEGFMAMLAADNKAAAVQYWELIREAFKKENRRTAIVFSLEQNNMWDDSDLTEEGKYEEILSAYDKDFGTNFVEVFYKDSQLGRAAHLSDVIKRSKQGEIDMLIVSDMLLTGYDNKLLNTIYIDKNVSQLHNFLQAVSRTNRLAGTQKKYGNVVLFSDRGMEKTFEKAIQLFGTAVNIEEIIDFTSFKDMEKKTRQCVMDLRDVAFSPDDLKNISTESDLRKVVKAYSNVRNAFENIRVYPEWDEDSGYVKAGISRDELDKYYSNIELMKDFILGNDPDDTEDKRLDTDFVVSTVDGEIIGYKYILKLLNNFVASPPSERDRWLRRIEEILRNTTDAEILQNKNAVERVLEAARNDEVPNVDTLFERLAVEINAERLRVFKDLANDLRIPFVLVEEMVDYRQREGKSMSKLHLIKLFRAFRKEYLMLDKEIEQPLLLEEASLRDFAELTRKRFDELFVD